LTTSKNFDLRGWLLGFRDDTEIYLKENGREAMDWIHLVQFRAQWRAIFNTVINLRIP
jgi:hypothetical protein